MDLRVAHAVTILFSDIEGSTQLARRLGPARWSALLAEHHRLLEAAVQSAGGSVVQTEGDGALAFLPSERAGVEAARRAQLSFRGTDWGDGVDRLRVRMGLHTGVVEPHPQGWVGLDLHLAARIAAAANGGQILVSSVTRRGLAADTELRDLGEHRLKDFPEPEHLHHVVIDQEPVPAPRSQPVRPTNLPPRTRPLVGRERERASLVALLRSPGAPVLTLTGVGGIGKTRLALQVAAELLEDFPGGVFVVRLAGIREAGALLPAVAESLGMSGGSPSSLMAQLAGRLGGRATLLVLDNFEQLLDAAPAVATLAAEAPASRMLVTSQFPLRLNTEQVVHLGPLEGEDSMDLFAERARARLGEFSLDEEDRQAVAEICERLDGMPLAIELAAARLATLGPRDLAQRLNRPLALLTRGDRDLPERQQSLRATIAWTCSLLDDGTRQLLAGLAVCAGPVPLSMIEALCRPERTPDEVLDDLDALLDSSLVRRIDDRRLGARYVVPQALRDYALEQLLTPDVEPVVRRRHAEQVAELAREAQLWKWGATEAQRVALLSVALEIRPAVAWAAHNDPALQVRLSAALAPYLVYRGVISETSEVLDQARASEAGTPAQRAWVVTLLAKCEQMQGNGARADTLSGEALDLWNQVPDDIERAVGFADLSWVLRWGQRFDDARRLMEQSLSSLRGSGDRRLILRGLVFMAHALADMADVPATLAVVDEAAALAGEDQVWELDAIRGDCALVGGEPSRAIRFYAKSLAWTSESGEAHQMLMDLRSLTLSLAQAGHAEPSLEMGEITRLIELETGRVGVPPELAADLGSALGSARETAGETACLAAITRARELEPGQRVVRALELAGSV
jgi:predicted ATPase/class 3 adenylate cyclase